MKSCDQIRCIEAPPCRSRILSEKIHDNYGEETLPAIVVVFVRMPTVDIASPNSQMRYSAQFSENPCLARPMLIQPLSVTQQQDGDAAHRAIKQPSAPCRLSLRRHRIGMIRGR